MINALFQNNATNITKFFPMPPFIMIIIKECVKTVLVKRRSFQVTPKFPKLINLLWSYFVTTFFFANQNNSAHTKISQPSSLTWHQCFLCDISHFRDITKRKCLGNFESPCISPIFNRSCVKQIYVIYLCRQNAPWIFFANHQCCTFLPVADKLSDCFKSCHMSNFMRRPMSLTRGRYDQY
jgi:hypothetical protein